MSVNDSQVLHATPILLALEEIDAQDSRFRVRDLNKDALADYQDARNKGAEFPAIEVWRDPETGRFALIHGRHRLEVARKVGDSKISVIEFTGTLDDARRRAFCANAENGKRLAGRSVEKAIRFAFGDPAMLGLSDREIAHRIGCNNATVSRWRKRAASERTAQKRKESEDEISTANASRANPGREK